MSRTPRYDEQFKMDAVRQVVERGYSVVDVAVRLGISDKTLYAWKNKYKDSLSPVERKKVDESAREIARLKAELRRVTEERDILKKAAAFFAKESQ